MQRATRIFLALAVGGLLFAQTVGFGTGSHFDLTRTVLAEYGFAETPIKMVQVGNWMTDYYATSPTHGEKHRDVLEKLHFDNLYDEEQVIAYWATLLRNIKTTTERAAESEDKMAMLVVLGVGLHAVQDFYAHSNWVELHPQKDPAEFRADTFIRAFNASRKPQFKGLHTGKYPDDRVTGPGEFDPPVDADIHGMHGFGLNKDSPLQRRWDDAYIFAYAGSHELVEAIKAWSEETNPGFWDEVREFELDTTEEENRLSRDIMATRNISMWLEGKGQDGIWKGPGSGSSRFFTAFSSKWLGSHRSMMMEDFHDGNVQDDIAAELYTRSARAEMPVLKPYEKARNALMIRVMYVSERNKSMIDPGQVLSMGGSDFYSRITVDRQEFWGRTVQNKRTAGDPWYEIFFFDPEVEKVPISISVWDEDHVDWTEDPHVDINPTGGIYDLTFSFDVLNGSLSGDIRGVFDSEQRSFLSEGAKPEKRRAAIRGYVSKLPIK